jgi:alpha-tubulin suppressor-like RCC1 family protein
VSVITNASQISAGRDYTCALLVTAAVECWGFNGYGQLGNGTTSDSSTPVPVTGLP